MIFALIIVFSATINISSCLSHEGLSLNELCSLEGSTYKEARDMIFGWCINDDACKEKLGQTSESMDVFEYYAGNSISNRDSSILWPVLEYFCSLNVTESEETIAAECIKSIKYESLLPFIKNFWLNTLMSEKLDNQIVCGAKYSAHVDKDTLKVQCSCLPDEDCSEPTNDLTPVYILVALAAVTFCLIFFINICNMVYSRKKNYVI